MAIIECSNLPECRPVEGFPGYWVSIDGRVFSHFSSGQPKILRDGTRQRNRLPDGQVRELALGKHPGGYPTVSMKNRSVRRWACVHRLVLEEFVGPRPPGQECRHLDGDARNCHLDNLCWGTRLENAADKKRHGTLEQGECHHAAKLTVAKVRKIRQMVAGGKLNKEVAPIFGVSASCISAIVTRRGWVHVKDTSFNSG